MTTGFGVDVCRYEVVSDDTTGSTLLMYSTNALARKKIKMIADNPATIAIAKVFVLSD
jgi:hypothetical protein